MLQKFSVIPNSNMFTLDGITAQVVNGEYVYVATVEFNGFFKWLKLGKYRYFIISATDINAQPEFVENQLFILLQLTLAKMPHEKFTPLIRLCSNWHNQFRVGRPRKSLLYSNALQRVWGFWSHAL